MKRVLILILLLSTALSAAWEWESFSTCNGPTMDYFDFYHVAYDPLQNYFLFAISSYGSDQFETWKLERRQWTLLADESSKDYHYSKGKMFFDLTLQTLVDFRTRTLDNYIEETDIYIWNHDLSGWELYDTLPIFTRDVAYDTTRKVYVFPGVGHGFFWDTMEYDLTTLTTFDEAHPPDDYVFTYDPIIQRSVVPNGATNKKVWLWDGETWTEAEKSPISYMWIAGSVFSPCHGGIVYVTPSNVIIFKNYEWSYLIEDIQLQDRARIRLLFNSKDEQIYSFSYLEFNGLYVDRLVNHKHGRPFDKP